MKWLLVLAFTSIAFSALEVDFTNWMSKYNKDYTGIEYNYRLAVFADNVARIQKLNGESDGCVYGLNQFADLTAIEFKAYLGYSPKAPIPAEQLETSVDAVPETFDWISKGKVTAVKDQAQCGSCWAFSVTENIESVWMIAKDLTPSNMEPLSPQQIVDCDDQDGGCEGGDPPTAYEYVIKAGGMDTEKSYPYKAADQTCHFIKADVFTTIKSWKYITKNKNETEMMEAVATVAPISICVDAEPWQLYESGIMKKSQCGTSLDHCVQITGYDHSSSTPFWTVRNSWGSSWGEKGFIRLEYGQNTCGLAEEATTAVV
jgi:C1A family cysteine protease